MTERGYEKIETFFRARPRLLALLRGLDRYLPPLFYTAYPGLVLVLLFLRDPRVLKVILVPAALFLLVTALRRLIDAKRPYELLAIRPLVPKNKKGESFPSRHAASAVAVAEAFAYVSLPAGIAAGILAVLVAAVRPLTGVHFPRDVIAGVLLSLVLGVPAFLFLPF